jgi:hypothetical protein
MKNIQDVIHKKTEFNVVLKNINLPWCQNVYIKSYFNDYCHFLMKKHKKAQIYISF